MYAIKTEKLTKKYKEKTAVSNLDLKIKEGEMYGLLGVNGAGKTTTMKIKRFAEINKDKAIK